MIENLFDVRLICQYLERNCRSENILRLCRQLQKGKVRLSDDLHIIIVMLNRMLRIFSRPTVPLLIINSGLNQQRTVNLLQKLKKVDYGNAKAVGLVVELNNHMPVQIDKIAEFLLSIRRQYGLKILGFSHAQVSPEAYYLLSHADTIYTTPSTVFQLARSVKTHSAQALMKSLGISKNVSKTNQNLIGAGLDSFSSANTSKFFNQKLTEINQRMHQYSMINRQGKLTNDSLELVPPSTIFGAEAIERGYADQMGNYFDILRNRYPECQLKHVRIKEKLSTRTLQLLIASPIIIVLFLLKVLLKYTILMYLWMQHRQSSKK